MSGFRPERKVDDSGKPWFRPNRHAGWSPGTLPRDYREAVERLHMAIHHLGAVPHLEDQLAKLRARSARQTAHAARLERRVVRQRDALRAANEQIARLERWKAEATELLVKWDTMHDVLGSPARLGESKVDASLAEARRLVGLPELSSATLRAAAAALRPDMPGRAAELDAYANMHRRGPGADT